MGQRDANFSYAINLMTRRRTLDDAVKRDRHYVIVIQAAMGVFEAGTGKQAPLKTMDFQINRPCETSTLTHTQMLYLMLL